MFHYITDNALRRTGNVICEGAVSRLKKSIFTDGAKETRPRVREPIREPRKQGERSFWDAAHLKGLF